MPERIVSRPSSAEYRAGWDRIFAREMGWTDIEPHREYGKETGEWQGRLDNQLRQLPHFAEILEEGVRAGGDK